MKKLMMSTLMGLGLLGASSARAQSSDPLLTLGPKVGLNYSTLAVSERSISTDYILGYHAGAFVRLSLGRLYVQPEASFNLKGSRLQLTDGGQQADADVRFRQIDVPVLIGRKLIDANNFNLRLMGGPVVSFLTDQDTDQLSEVRRVDYRDRTWGAQVGLGADVGSLTVDIRYETGLSWFDTSLGQRQRLFQATVGLKLF